MGLCITDEMDKNINEIGEILEELCLKIWRIKIIFSDLININKER